MTYKIGDIVCESRKDSALRNGTSNHFVILRVVSEFLKGPIKKYVCYWIEGDENIGPITLNETENWRYDIVARPSSN
jgi:hypothetical protein